MKKTLIAASIMGLASSAAYATKARLQALGQNSDDNYYVKDSRSVFYNAAYVNHYANTMVTEWGTDSSSLDTTAAPKAEGGFFQSMGNMTYGVYLGNESNTGALVRLAAESTAGELLKADNVFNAFVAGEATSMKWGVGLLYTKAKSENSTAPTSDKEESNMAVRLGALGSNWEGYANVSLKGESKTKAATPSEFKGDLGLHLGGAYDMGDNRLAASYKALSWKQRNTFQTTDAEGKLNILHVGWGNTKDLGGGASVITQLYYESTKVEGKFTTNPAEMTHTIVPVVVGFETKANDWLSWRASVKHNVMGTVEQKNILGGGGSQNFTATFAGTLASVFGTNSGLVTAGATQKRSIANKTTVAGGATLNFGKLAVDGMLGTVTSGSMRLDQVMTRVGVTYGF